jgi:hypothetical protein
MTKSFVLCVSRRVFLSALAALATMFVAAGAFTATPARGGCGGIAAAAPIPGAISEAAGDGWQSSWLDLNSPMSFKKDERLRFQLRGDAQKVLIRLLPSGSQPSSPDGIEGKARGVPTDGILEVTLEHNHPNVKQISVHAGKEAWGNRLNDNNGKVRLISVVNCVK